MGTGVCVAICVYITVCVHKCILACSLEISDPVGGERGVGPLKMRCCILKADPDQNLNPSLSNPRPQVCDLHSLLTPEQIEAMENYFFFFCSFLFFSLQQRSRLSSDQKASSARTVKQVPTTDEMEC